MSNRRTLPSGYALPGWVECFSYVFLICLVTPLCALAFSLSHQDLWMSAFGLKVYACQHLATYLFLVFLPFAGGLAAIGLLRRKPWGLVLSAVYSPMAIGVCCISLAVNHSSGIKDHSAWVELILLLCFVRWLQCTMTGQSPQPAPRCPFARGG